VPFQNIDLFRGSLNSPDLPLSTLLGDGLS
jgi:hypothetical protein